MRTAMIAVIIALLGAVVAPADTIVVDAGGGGDHVTIQAGLDAATDGDTIEVVAGTYAGSGNRNLDFGTKNLTLVSRSGAVATVIDNQGGGEHRLFDFYDGGQDTTCVIDGFTVRGGRMTSSDGAGIRCVASSPKIVNCRFESNLAGGFRGGAVFLDSRANAVIRDCEFVENAATRGGAVHVASNCAPRISDCLFLWNEATEEGGAVHFGFSATNGSVLGCLFIENESGANGGAMTFDRGAPVVTGCTYVRNVAGVGGGALHMTNQANSFFTSCTFVGNSATQQGGCVKATMTTQFLLFTQCIFAFTGPCNDKTIYKDGTSIVTLNWSCSWSNAPGDILPMSPQAYIIEDPLFCDVTSDDLTLAADSPCLPGGNTWNRLMGAYGEGCAQSVVEQHSWGAIKAMYR